MGIPRLAFCWIYAYLITHRLGYVVLVYVSLLFINSHICGYVFESFRIADSWNHDVVYLHYGIYPFTFIILFSVYTVYNYCTTHYSLSDLFLVFNLTLWNAECFAFFKPSILCFLKDTKHNEFCVDLLYRKQQLAFKTELMEEDESNMADKEAWRYVSLGIQYLCVDYLYSYACTQYLIGNEVFPLKSLFLFILVRRTVSVSTSVHSDQL